MDKLFKIKKINEVINDREYILDNVYPRVINYEYNKDKFENIYYERYLDLAIIYRIDITGKGIKYYSSTTRLTHDMMNKLGISEDELKSRAISVDKKNKDLIVAISNKNTLYGAAAILLTDLIDKVSDDLGGGDLFIMPSSVHEIIVTKRENITLKKAREIVNQVNGDNQIISADIKLSDNVYIYDKLQHRIYIAK